MERTRSHSLPLFLIVLFVVSLLSPLAAHQQTTPVELDSVQAINEASARATSPEIFLSAGGAATGDEFDTMIAPGLDGYYVGGDFNRSMTFGNHQLQPTSPYSNGNEFYIAGIDSTGSWTFLAGADHSMGGVSFLTDITTVNGMAVITGYMFGQVNFGQTILNTQVLDGFVAVADPTGNWMWATAFQTLPNTTTDASIPQAISVDNVGDIVVAGYFSGETDFGGTAINVSNPEVFIAKLDGANGALKWVTSGGGIGQQVVTDVVTDLNGDYHISCLTQNNVLFGTTSYSTVGTQDSFIIKMTSAGSVTGISGYGIPSQIVSVEYMSIDSTGALYLGGIFEGTLAQSGWSITANKGGSDVFFIKKGSGSSNSNWAVIGGTNGNDVLEGMEMTSKDELIFTGYAQGTFTAGNKAITPDGNYDALVGGVSKTGSWTWLDVTDSPDFETGRGIAINGSDVVAVVGAFGGQSSSPSITKGGTTVTSTGGWDVYVWAFDSSMKQDSDSDGVPDFEDNCPSVANPGQGNTDFDEKGDECDPDDDNDGLTDNSPDLCARGGQYNWTSTQDFNDPANSTDWDRDGCRDGIEDDDIDNDGVNDDVDLCPRTSYNPPRPTWVSEASTDIDGDGCRDVDEDNDDDGDGFSDGSDDCSSIAGTSTLGEVGCLDTDGDGWADSRDDCPNQFGNSSENGKIACLDTDGDGWADVDDAFVNEPTQWADSDLDTYGDSAAGINPDACPNSAGTSTMDRIGCIDSDGDGYSNPDALWGVEDGADAFVDDNTQWSDFDADGFGDNYANQSWDDRNPDWPGTYVANAYNQDACPTREGTSWMDDTAGCPDADGDGWYNLHDAFPVDNTQWSDEDGDGYGDNQSGTTPDACIQRPGGSFTDRFGCSDYDEDGVSDPDPSANYFVSDGADAFFDEPTQWADSDIDGYGDNPLGFQPDACPELRDSSTVDRFGCADSDGDGISDPDTVWTTDNGADACPLVYGNSSADRIGCLDQDGDNYSDPTADWSLADGADAYPKDPTRWIKEADEDTQGASSMTTYLVGGVGFLILAGIGVLLFVRSKGEDETKAWANATAGQVAMPNFQAQPAAQVAMPNFQAQPAAQVAMPNFQAQPVAQIPPQPMAMPDPARDYYNGLLAQGYPHAEALSYTQQYFQEFRG